MFNFLKGILIGIGGITPGLSGSVLMVIFGLYEKVIETIRNLFTFKNFKNDLLFLIPIGLGMVSGVLLFSKIVNFLLERYEMYTRFTFLGLVIGTLPLFYKEVKKKDFKNIYHILIAFAVLAGLLLLFLGKGLFPQVDNPAPPQSFFMGFTFAASATVPGIDNSVILSVFGFYEGFVSALDSINIYVLAFVAVGVIVGVISISFIMNFLLKKHYSITFSIIFGLFISIIPSVLNESCVLALNMASAISILLMILGFFASYLLGTKKKD
ncbi:MAG: DUF368 domain-containing protein [Lachnospiraceae bacterium]|jgi:putative membrane protein|nr:DUF368 domain-containing protein [Lachnospiraceae bacterium]